MDVVQTPQFRLYISVSTFRWRNLQNVSNALYIQYGKHDTLKKIAWGPLPTNSVSQLLWSVVREPDREMH